MQITGRRYDTNQTVRLTCEGGVVQSIESLPDAGEDTPILAPGFVDLQVNGHGGIEFNVQSLTAEQVETAFVAFDQYGVTRISPTAITNGFEMLEHALKTLAGAKEESPQVAARWCGIHLEGPYLSREDGPRGAHPLEHARPPCWDEFQKLQAAAQGEIRILTLSPEYDGSAEFIAQVVKTGVRVAIGHTAANSDQITAAVDAGASLSTHLGNGSHGQIRRHPNYIWDQLADDRLIASLIVDGHHLPASVVKSFVRAKTPERCLLVSDVTAMLGMPPGRYETEGMSAVELLANGKAVVAGQQQYLAGAALPMGVCVATVMAYAGVDLTTAIAMATTTPAEYIGCPCGGFEQGSTADFVLFHLSEDTPAKFIVQQTVLAGEVVYQS